MATCSYKPLNQKSFVQPLAGADPRTEDGRKLHKGFLTKIRPVFS
jgi:hypothetical protein